MEVVRLLLEDQRVHRKITACINVATHKGNVEVVELLQSYYKDDEGKDDDSDQYYVSKFPSYNNIRMKISKKRKYKDKN